MCLTEGECDAFRPVFDESIFIFHEINTCTSVDLDRLHGKKPPTTNCSIFIQNFFKNIATTETQIRHIPQSIFLHSVSRQNCVFFLNQVFFFLHTSTENCFKGHEPPWKLTSCRYWTHQKKKVFYLKFNYLLVWRDSFVPFLGLLTLKKLERGNHLQWGEMKSLLSGWPL